MKTGVKAGSVVIVEDIVLLKGGLSVRTRSGIVRWIKSDEIRSFTQSGLVNMMVIGKSRTTDIQLTSYFCSGASLPSTKNEMDTAISLDDIAHFSYLQGKGGIFEWLLHLPGTKDAEVPAFLSRAAVREFLCELGKFLVRSVDLSFVVSKELNSFGL